MNLTIKKLRDQRHIIRQLNDGKFGAPSIIPATGSSPAGTSPPA